MSDDDCTACYTGEPDDQHTCESRPLNFGACVADAMLDVMPGATFHDAAKLVAALRRSLGRAGIVIVEPPR